MNYLLKKYDLLDENGEVYITYVNTDELEDTEIKEDFNRWMRGQTVPVIEGVTGAVYSWDWERWWEMKVLGKPTYFD